jgi:hypothetical protein
VDEFVFIFRIGETAQREATGTPARARQGLRAWAEWIRGLETGGHLRQGGRALPPAGRVVRGRERRITEGPCVKAGELVAGFVVVAARDLAQATELASGCPMLPGGGAVEIRPVPGAASGRSRPPRRG